MTYRQLPRPQPPIIDREGKRLLTLQESADLTGTSLSFIKREMDAQRLKTVKIGHLRRVRPADLDAWVNSYADGEQSA